MPPKESSKPTERTKKILSLCALAFFVLFSAFIAWYVGRPLIARVSDPAAFRQWVDQHGLVSRFAFVGMVVLQVLVAIIPGEPFEIVAGYAFGTLEGVALCMIGAFIGSVLVFLLVKRFGMMFVEVFFSREKIHSLKFLQDAKRLNSLVFLIFLIPGTPKDLLSYFVGLTPMKLSVWMLITTIARLPAILSSVIGGDAIGTQNYCAAIIVFVVTGIASGIGLLLYNKFSKKNSAQVSLQDTDRSVSPGKEKSNLQP